MKIKLDKRAEKAYFKLPLHIQKKAKKKFLLLDEGISSKSLKAKKMAGADRYEARIDYHYRFTFIVDADVILILSIGMHDVGLGKK